MTRAAPLERTTERFSISSEGVARLCAEIHLRQDPDDYRVTLPVRLALASLGELEIALFCQGVDHGFASGTITFTSVRAMNEGLVAAVRAGYYGFRVLNYLRSKKKLSDTIYSSERS